MLLFGGEEVEYGERSRMLAYCSKYRFEYNAFVVKRPDFYSNFFLVDIDKWRFQFYGIESKKDKIIKCDEDNGYYIN